MGKLFPERIFSLSEGPAWAVLVTAVCMTERGISSSGAQGILAVRGVPSGTGLEGSTTQGMWGTAPESPR